MVENQNMIMIKRQKVNTTLNLGRLQRYRPNWPWRSFAGSPAVIHWVTKDLESLDLALEKVPGRKVALQAGGSVGLFPKRLAEEFESVYTFEPDPKLFAQLEQNAPETNIIPVRVALGNSNDPVRLECRRRDNSGRPVHEGLTHIAGPGDIPQMRIDELGLEACDLIYLDIEGYEMEALAGGEETIAKLRPVIGIEVNGNGAHYNYSKEQTAQWFSDRDYVFVLRHRGDDLYLPKELMNGS